MGAVQAIRGAVGAVVEIYDVYSSPRGWLAPDVQRLIADIPIPRMDARTSTQGNRLEMDKAGVK